MLLVGDHLQRGSVDAGGAFAMLARRGPIAELTSLRRFRHPWEARASLQLRRGQPAALDTYDAHRAFVGGFREQVLDVAVREYLAVGAEGRVSVLQATDNRTVRELNAMTHSAGVREGAVRPGEVELHDGLVAGVGDRVVTRRNHRHLHTPDGFVRNGDLWDVVGVHDGALRVQAASTAGRGGDARAVLPAAYVAEHVELGYATSTARTQGMTVDETHTVAATEMARENLYVGMSRGRDLNRGYVVTDWVDDCVPGGASPATSYREVLDGILATSHAEPTATETWETYHPGEPAPLPVPPLRPPHDYGRTGSNRPPVPAPTPTSGRDQLTRISPLTDTKERHVDHRHRLEGAALPHGRRGRRRARRHRALHPQARRRRRPPRRQGRRPRRPNPQDRPREPAPAGARHPEARAAVAASMTATAA